MSVNANARRRWFGGFCLLAAVVMVGLGVTLLETRLTGATLILYWLACFVLTALAAGTALVDAAHVRRVQREEHRALLERTLLEIEHHKASRTESKR